MPCVLSPLTDNSNTVLIKSIDVATLVDKWLNQFNIDITNEIDSVSKIHLYMCNDTKLHFFVPNTLDGSAKLYEKLQQYDWYYMKNKWEHRVALHDIEKRNKVLEIGSGFGGFVQEAVSKGLDVLGIELNQEAAKQGKQNSLPIETTELSELCKTHFDSFDVVCSFQVLEHISRPKEFIDASLKLLKPGGKLIYCVPNSESFLKYQDNILDMPPHHMTQWSKYTFKALEDLFPVHLEKVKYEPLAHYHVDSYLGAYSNYYRSLSPIFKLVFNSKIFPLYNRFLNMGARQMLKGQSIYVQFRKL